MIMNHTCRRRNLIRSALLQLFLIVSIKSNQAVREDLGRHWYDAPDEESSSFDDTLPGKRSFDSINYASRFGWLRKKSHDTIREPEGGEFESLDKKPFDSIEGASSFRGLNKKQYYDSIEDHESDFPDEPTDDGSEWGNVEKKPFDSIDGASTFRGLNKKRDDLFGNEGHFPDLEENSFVPQFIDDGRHVEKKPFDSIDGASTFRGLNKKFFRNALAGAHRRYGGGGGLHDPRPVNARRPL